MTRVILHIGLHKTGTTFIQKRIEANESLLPDGFGLIPRDDATLSALTVETRKLRSIDEARLASPVITSLARELGKKCLAFETVLVSHEDILGPVPTRGNIRGLYPYIAEVLPAVLAGLSDSGVKVEVAVYRRNYRDWLGSIFRYRFMDRTDRAFRPKRFIANNEMPVNWVEFMERLRVAAGQHPLHMFSFEKDRETGNMGSSLFSLFGLSEEIQRKFPPMDAMNVSRLTTVDPDWDDD